MYKRAFLKLLLSALLPVALDTPAVAQGVISAFRNPGCGCCEKWAEMLTAAGFEVNMQDDANLEARRVAAGVPVDLAGCHTAMLGDYVLEGHVPLSEIEKLVSERPAIRGIAVAGMPMGSPGMEMGDDHDAYDVVAFKADGTRSVFAHYEAKL
jgi:hypothetical protein